MFVAALRKLLEQLPIPIQLKDIFSLGYQTFFFIWIIFTQSGKKQGSSLDPYKYIGLTHCYL